MTAATHTFLYPRADIGLTAEELAAFAASLDPRDPLYWPALAAADGCEASLAELNTMLVEDDCYPFLPERSVAFMPGVAA